VKLGFIGMGIMGAPMATQAFAQRITALRCDDPDVPISSAKAGTLTIRVGGHDATIERGKPLFELMGKSITLVGGHADGQATKVANRITRRWSRRWR
jgi:2-hydroxy-3-oxopropionate reductase